MCASDEEISDGTYHRGNPSLILLQQRQKIKGSNRIDGFRL